MWIAGCVQGLGKVAAGLWISRYAGRHVDCASTCEFVTCYLVTGYVLNSVRCLRRIRDRNCPDTRKSPLCDPSPTAQSGLRFVEGTAVSTRPLCPSVPRRQIPFNWSIEIPLQNRVTIPDNSQQISQERRKPGLFASNSARTFTVVREIRIHAPPVAVGKSCLNAGHARRKSGCNASSVSRSIALACPRNAYKRKCRCNSPSKCGLARGKRGRTRPIVG